VSPKLADPSPPVAAPSTGADLRPIAGVGAPQGPPERASPSSDAEQPAGGARRMVEELAALPWAAWLTSTIVHATLLIVLSLFLLTTPEDELLWLTGSVQPDLVEDMDVQVDEIPALAGEASLGPIAEGDAIDLPGASASTTGSARTGPANRGVGSPGAQELVAIAPAGERAGGSFASDLAALTNPLESRGGGLEGRRFENRTAAALSGGGSRESEAAVELGLAWLAEHQYPDGGWRFDLEAHPRCMGACRDSGTYKTSTAATGLAVLSFLGAGYTHQEGKYQEVVDRGLYYLTEHMNITSRGGDLRDVGADPEAQVELGFVGGFNLPSFRRDTMYSHGIATLALTEAYAMTHDRALRKSAEEAVKFIVNAQYDDGGWRYNPKWENQGPGDMTVTGWQLMALKSAVLGGIEVPYDVWLRASAFIDTLQADNGERYTYVVNERGTNATSAIGLLCRMLGGWPRESRPLQRGTSRLADELPVQNNVYFIYYASQVLHHLGGPRWDKWNARMRPYLVDSQAQDGHERGSWYFAESHSTPGGRLYTTTMAIMTLEVYYRYMPLYKQPAVDRAP
jgi:hypothetical protein